MSQQQQTYSQYYPDELNPFGSDDEDGEQNPKLAEHNNKSSTKTTTPKIEYPKYLSPFGDDEDEGGAELNYNDNDTAKKGHAKGGTSIVLNSSVQSVSTVDDYDDSLNPFGDEEDNLQANAILIAKQSIHDKLHASTTAQNDSCGNPFDEDEEREESKTESTDQVSDSLNSIEPPHHSLPNVLDKPPIPMPRTKSLLKKEQLRKQEKTLPPLPTRPPPTINNVPRKKRVPPQVPVNFKRQVCGSSEDYEKELNKISDELTNIEKESIEFKKILESSQQLNLDEKEKAKRSYIDLIKKRETLVKRQKELMYRRREIALDQIHSDIDYELRTICNKQESNTTSADQTREEELLKRLVEIVEEKSDIVENLNKVYASDNNDVEEALTRLNLSETSNDADKKKKTNNNNGSLRIPEDFDKSKHLSKFTKFATLLPKGATLKNPIKLKKKRPKSQTIAQ